MDGAILRHGNCKNNIKGHEDMQGSENGTVNRKGTKDEKGTEMVTENRKGKWKGLGM